jgi:hypothetical protein
MHRQAPLSALSAIDEVQHDPSARCPVTLMPGESLSPSVHGANTSIVVLVIDRVVVGVIDEDALGRVRSTVCETLARPPKKAPIATPTAMKAIMARRSLIMPASPNW